jgi:hypothetical protein
VFLKSYLFSPTPTNHLPGPNILALTLCVNSKTSLCQKDASHCVGTTEFSVNSVQQLQRPRRIDEDMSKVVGNVRIQSVLMFIVLNLFF